MSFIDDLLNIIFGRKEIKMTETVIPIDLDSINFEESANKSSRKREIDSIVLHHTGPGSFSGIVSWLKNPDANVSAHYVVGKAGEITQLVKLKDKAWHAGKSKCIIDGKTVYDLNQNSIGIEIQNIGLLDKIDGKYYYEVGRKLKEYKGKVEFGKIIYPNGNVVEGYYVPYPEAQVEKVLSLCKAVVNKYPSIKQGNIFGHYWIGLPQGRKNDPFGLDIEEIKNKIFS